MFLVRTRNELLAMNTDDYFSERAKQVDVNAALKFLSRKGGIAPKDDDVLTD